MRNTSCPIQTTKVLISTGGKKSKIQPKSMLKLVAGLEDTLWNWQEKIPMKLFSDLN